MVPLGAPERLLPTESTGIDLREARSQNRPPTRDSGFGDRPSRYQGGNYDEVAPRRSFRDQDDGPTRTFSRRTETSGDGAPAEADEDWRAGPARAVSGMSRFESQDAPERRTTRRSVEEEKDTAADLEDDWRAGASAAPRASAFGERRMSRRDDEEAPVRRFSSRRDEDEGPRRFTSVRKEEETRADDDDWRRPSREISERVERIDESARMDRTRSIRPVVATRADEEDDWRTVKSAAAPVAGSSATPWARRTAAAPVVDTPPRVMVKKPTATPATVQAKPTPAAVEEDKWSSDEDEVVAIEEEKQPDMDKINKFVGKVAQYVEVSASEDVVKKIDAIVKKIPVNFAKPELASLEPMRCVVNVALKTDLLVSEPEVQRIVALVAPILVCLEEQFVSFRGSVEKYQVALLEEVQKFVSAAGCSRLSPETALVEALWLALYEKRVVCEEAFTLWLEDEILASPGKSTTVFQTEAFRAWINEAELPGVEASRKTAPAAGEAKDEWSSSGEDSDIEALVPKRLGAGVHLRPAAVAPLRR